MFYYQFLKYKNSYSKRRELYRQKTAVSDLHAGVSYPFFLVKKSYTFDMHLQSFLSFYQHKDPSQMETQNMKIFIILTRMAASCSSGALFFV